VGVGVSVIVTVADGVGERVIVDVGVGGGAIEAARVGVIVE
jgi:hypothetical protein